jgi:hypothetical protein
MMDPSVTDAGMVEPEAVTPAPPVVTPSEERTTKSLSRGDAVYHLETPARCPQCGEVLSELRAIRLLRVEVNFTSMLPRRGRIVVCPYCQTIVPAELTNL